MSNSRINHLDLQAYDDKIRDFREILKFSIYSKQDLIDRLHLIETWINFKGLEINLLDQSFLDQNLVLSIASELQPFYQKLWVIQSRSDVVDIYKHLSLIVKEIYSIEEILNDWESRQYTVQTYEKMIYDLETESYFIDELEERFDRYMNLQIFYSDQNIHFLHLSDLITQYQERILVRAQHCVKGVNFFMIKCPKGQFWMGNDLGEEDEKPKHQVILNQSFWVGETQVTQALWDKVMGWNNSHFQASIDLPVETITWYDCLDFCNQLSILEGFEPCFVLKNIEKDGNHIKRADVEWKKEANGYRLPTEAEWEYFAKADQETYYGGSNRIDEVAWYQNNADEKTHEVKGKKANKWRLFDLSGNVKEWCMDEYDEIYQERINETSINPVLWRNQPIENVLRGGSYLNDEELCLLRHRASAPPCSLSAHLGLRLLRNA